MTVAEFLKILFTIAAIFTKLLEICFSPSLCKFCFKGLRVCECDVE